MPVLNHSAWNCYDASAVVSLPIHDADARIVIVLRSTRLLFFILAVRMMPYMPPPSGSMLKLRPARSFGRASGQLPIAMGAPVQEIPPPSPIDNGRHGTVRQGLEHSRQFSHRLDGT